MPNDYLDASTFSWFFRPNAWRARHRVVVRLDMIRRGVM